MGKRVEVVGCGKVNSAKELEQYKLLVNPDRWRKMDNFSRMAVVAARLALIDAGLNQEDLSREESGVVLATPYGPVESHKRFIEDIYRYGLHLASAFVFPNTVMNMAAGMISLELGIKGPNITMVTVKTGKEDALSYAEFLIEQGKAQMMLAGVVNEVNEITQLLEPELREGAEVLVLR